MSSSKFTEQSINRIASWVVEFLTVPFDSTMDILLRNVYHHATRKFLDISKVILKKMLLICTTRPPFRNIDGKLHVQVNGVRSTKTHARLTLHVRFKKKKHATNNLVLKPTTYYRYVDYFFCYR